MINKITKFYNLLKALVNFLNIRKWGVISEIQEKTNFDHAFSISYSQGAEDISLSLLIQDTDGFYIDIGAHHPSRFSVTRLLYQKGWNGINVDANPDTASEFKRHRPRDQFLNAAVGSQNIYTFYRFKEPAINTVNSDWMSRFASEGNPVVDILQIPGLTLRKIFEYVPQDKSVTLLNIDIEGSDNEALNSLDFDSLPVRLKPKWLLLETTPPLANILNTPSIEYSVKNNYEIYLVLPMATLLKNKMN